MQRGQTSIALIALIFEGILALVSAIHWLILRDADTTLYPRPPTLFEFIFGSTLALALFVGIFAVLRALKSFPTLKVDEFMSEKVLPFAGKIDHRSALIVSLAAGIGEELFFRTVVQPYLGIVVTGILFGLAHFLSEIFLYPLIALLYCIVGVFFSLIYVSSDSLWVPLIAHSLYDYLAILYLKYRYTNSST